MTDPITLLILGLAVFRLTRLLTEDVILETPRNAIWRRYPPESSKLGYLFTCVWCMSFWVAILVVTFYILFPTAMMVVALVLALSAIAGIIGHLLDR